jgi:hypothetical protein
MSDQWSTPTTDEVERLLVSIADFSLRSLFFNELENPEWLAPLVSLGVFRDPPEPQTDAEGVTRALPWPEGNFLVRVSGDRPEQVTEALRAVAASKNPWVHRIIISAVSRLPTEQAKQLAQPVVKIIKSSTDWLDTDELMTAVIRLSAAGEFTTVKQLLKAIFEPRPGAKEEMAFGTQTRVRGAIEDYSYTEMLPRTVSILAALDGIDGLKLVAGWLDKASGIQSSPQAGQPQLEFSSVWRPSIAAHAQNSGMHEITDSLIDVVLDTAVEVGRKGQQTRVVEYLNSAKPFLMRRIATEAAARLLADDFAAEELVPAALRLLLDPTLMGIGSRPEYVRLAIALLPRLTEGQRGLWIALVQSESWQGSDEDMRLMNAWGNKSAEEVSSVEVAETRQHLLHRFLQPLADCLPAPLDRELAALEAKWGKIAHAEFGSYMESFTGPTSPKSRDQLSAMAVGELVAFLRAWKPPIDRHFGPSVRGLARELEALTEVKPDLVATIADELLNTGRSYVRAALSGWAKAVTHGFIPTDSVWALVGAVVRQPDDASDDLSQRDFDADDPVWRWAQRGAVELIEACATALPRPAPAESVSNLWSLLKPLTSHADPTAEHEARYGGSNMDPLTLSLNTTRPAAIRAGIGLASASHDGKELGNPDACEAEILQTIAGHIDGFSDPSLAVAAVIGEGLGRLWRIDPNWIESRQVDLFSVLDSNDLRRARSDVIVSVALRQYRTGKVFIDLMRPAIAQILSRRYYEFDHTEGWRGDRSAADAAALHMVTAYLLRVIERDDPELERVFSDSPDAVASEVIGRIGWQIMRTTTDSTGDTIPDDYLQRAKELVDWRVEEIEEGRASADELTGLHWWAQSGVFSPAWWLPILRLTINGIGSDSRGLLGSPLADAASSEPALATELFEQLYGNLDNDWRNYNYVRHAPRLLAAAMQSGDDVAVAAANRVKDALGRQGHFQSLHELEQLIENGAEQVDDHL